ncbi:MAG: 3-oxoacyl-ACP synthase [Alphaproteobacteria bacterium]|nr:3-oxoacyl-ACP synthase [Alphaproteobacteria bacterium]
MRQLITAYTLIDGFKCMVNGRLLFYQENILTFADFIKALYKQEQVNYPKFYKMDALGKLGFIASELLLRNKDIKSYPPELTGVVLSNSSSSLDTDIAHNETIRDREHYFPSPSVFVYTLPNIVIGEICIRNGIKGENAFLVSESFNSELIAGYVTDLFSRELVKGCLCGWIEVLGNRCEAFLVWVENQADVAETKPGPFNPVPFDAEHLKLLKNQNDR